MRYAICNETFQDWDWASTCQAVADSGYQGIEVAPFTLAEDIRTLQSSDRRELAHSALRAGLDIVGLHWLLVSPKGLSLTSQDPALRTATADYLVALVDFCADLGGHILVLGSPAQRRIPDDDNATLAAERLQHCLEPALERALLHRISLCIEPLPPPEADFILTLSEATALIRRIGHPSLRTIFDVKSASSEDTSLPALICEYAPYIAHVHANDANRRGPGFGETDFLPILSTLQTVGYDGYVSVEVFDHTPDPITIARNSIDYLRRCEAAIPSAG